MTVHSLFLEEHPFMTTDRRLTDAAQRRTNPDQVFGDMRFEYPSGVSAAERTAAAAHFQTRAEGALQLARLRAPEIQAGELLRDYRKRLLHLVQAHCDCDPKLRKVEASRIPRDALPNFEKLIISGTVERFKRPEGPERSLTRRDQAGREITEFFGDQEASWLPFTNCIANNGEVIGWRSGRIAHELCTGKNGPEARAEAARQAAVYAAGEKALAAAGASAAAG
jgi:hypothetical protein